ncbi:MAG: hypothetical protein Q8835_03560, partial [Sweet potato little leaf phytoplasma]|nr:hypothetical protein [Sweet potato little leaf phytoplasma]
FIKDFSKISKPLYNLLCTDHVFYFNAYCRKAFETLKVALISAPVLCAPNWDWGICTNNKNWQKYCKNSKKIKLLAEIAKNTLNYENTLSISNSLLLPIIDSHS